MFTATLFTIAKTWKEVSIDKIEMFRNIWKGINTFTKKKQR